MKIVGVASYSTSTPLRLAVLDLDAEERRHVRDSRCLLHVVRHDHDGVLTLEIVHQVLDARRRDGVEGGCRLVHEQDVGLDGEAARDAEPLLLAAREAESTVLETVLDLVPESGLMEGPLDAAVKVVGHAEDARAEGDVVVDRLRERVRLLEDHPDPPPHLHRVHIGPVEVFTAVKDRPLHDSTGDQVVHAVEAANECALAAAGGT